MIINAADRDALTKQIDNAKKADVQFVTCCSIAEAGNGLLYNTATDKQNGAIGDYLAAEIVADSNGKADALYVNISAFEILKAVGEHLPDRDEGILPRLRGVESIDIPATSLGKDAPDRIISYLRSHPDSELHRAVRERRARRRAPGRAEGRGTRRQGQDRRPGWRQPDVPGSPQR